MRKPLSVLVPLGLAVLAGCSEPTPTGPDATVTRDENRFARLDGSSVRVMTQNMYVGADVDAVIAALASPDPGDDLPALLVAIETLQATDFPARAGAMAREIARATPDAVGLQEVSRIDLDLTGLGLGTVMHLDFLPMLLDSLTALGTQYQPAASVLNIVAQPLPGISLQDFDVLLVNTRRVEVTAASGRSYTAAIGVVAPGVTLKRGFVMVQGTVAGQPYGFASTHLESGSAPGLPELRAAQAAELVAALPTDVPVLVMGDFNDTPGSPVYQLMGQAGLVDGWHALRPGVEGLTCCEASDLSNSLPSLTQRLDYVWARHFPGSDTELEGQIVRVGARPADRIAGPLYPIWPSDHAGLVLTLGEDQ